MTLPGWPGVVLHTHVYHKREGVRNSQNDHKFQAMASDLRRTGPIIPWNLPIEGRQYMADVWTMPVFSGKLQTFSQYVHLKHRKAGMPFWYKEVGKEPPIM